jgi:predicted HNH restriction endonuclease
MGRYDPKISVSRYRAALLAIEERVTDTHRALISAHHAAPAKTTTAAALAVEMGYDSWGGTNLQYGRFAGLLCEQLGVRYAQHLHVIVDATKEDGGDFKLRLRDNFVTAIEQLGWVEPRAIRSKERIKASQTVHDALEGSVSERLTLQRTRDRALRLSKLEDARKSSADGRLQCEVPGCGFDFEAVYGRIGRGYAHVHHRHPLSQRRSPTRTRLSDLAVVCANCHAMIHQGGECRALENLITANKRRMSRNRSSSS